MVPAGKAYVEVLLFTAAQNSIDALERLRESYKGLLAPGALTEADQAVLVAVEATLRQVKNAHRLV